MAFTRAIIAEKLGFLVTDFGFEFDYCNESGEHFFFKNELGHIEFYEWAQFNEFKINVKIRNCSKRINMPVLYAKELGAFNQRHKGLKWLFKDKRPDFWQMIADIIKKEIETSNSVFGLKITD